MLSHLSEDIRQYLIITGNYWVFTLTDGALRMLVVLHFHHLGYSPLDIALLFLFYEIFGVITNLFGGWLGAVIGLNRTMNTGLLLQMVALAMLLVPAASLTVVWVMAAQALSGIAKDLNKMSAKSAIKNLVPSDNGETEQALFRWVAILTGSKNALKGIGFFLGGALLALLGFRQTLWVMLFALFATLLFSLWRLKTDLGKSKNKPKFTHIFSKDKAINILSAARLFLFAARDVWFVVALPVYFSQTLQWNHWQVGSFLAAWVIGYGIVQSQAPRLFLRANNHLHTAEKGSQASLSPARSTCSWAMGLAAITTLIPIALLWPLNPTSVLIVGLAFFGFFFAINSALHSYLIVSFSRSDGTSLDVGFYYMANAMGRLLGTLLSGWLFQASGLIACLWVSAAMLVTTALLSCAMPSTINSTHPSEKT